MEDREEDSERRRCLIDIYKLDLQIRKLLRELNELGPEYGEIGSFKETEDYLKYLKFTLAELTGEIVKPPDKERFVLKGDDGDRYILNCCSKVDKPKLVSGTRVTHEMKTLTILRILPPKHRGYVSYSNLGGLSDQIKVLREYIELPLTKPELFERVGVKPPKGVLLCGPLGTGKTLLAKAIASNTNSNFLTVVSSAPLAKNLGDSSLLVREMFKYAHDHQPCIIFMDEIDAIDGRRQSSEGEVKTSEYNRVLIELLSQVKVIMAKNRPDVLDSALIPPGRIDKKIEIPLPNQDSRMRILKIHASDITKHGEIDYEKVVKLSEGFNGADMRNICTEAGMFALRAERDYVVPNDFIKAVIKLIGAKKLESSSQYNAEL